MSRVSSVSVFPISSPYRRAALFMLTADNSVFGEGFSGDNPTGWREGSKVDPGAARSHFIFRAGRVDSGARSGLRRPAAAATAEGPSRLTRAGRAEAKHVTARRCCSLQSGRRHRRQAVGVRETARETRWVLMR